MTLGTTNLAASVMNFSNVIISVVSQLVDVFFFYV
jgi:hypothetical protein